jgi:uncharacterized protein YihD (DUF1040 family)
MSRDPKRIRKFCNQLATEWEKNPDLRFGQFIMNVLGRVGKDTKRDVFFIEDDEMMEAIQRALSKPGATPYKKN